MSQKKKQIGRYRIRIENFIYAYSGKLIQIYLRCRSLLKYSFWGTLSNNTLKLKIGLVVKNSF